MKLAWHIFRKDLRRLSVPLLLWGGLFVIHFLAYANLGLDDDVTTFLNLLWGLQVLVAWLLVALLIQADPLMSDTAAWRTRPISGARLLGGKLLGLLLMFSVWPALLTLPWWIHFDFSFAHLLGVLAANVQGFALLALIAAALAAVTTELLRYLAWSCVLFTVGGFGFFTFWAEFPSRMTEDVSLPMLLTRVHLAAAIIMITAPVVVGLQYLTRRVSLSIGIGTVALATAVGVLARWPWSAAELLPGSRSALPVASLRVPAATAFVPPPGSNEKAALQLHVAPVVDQVAAGDAVSWLAFDGALGHGETGRLPVTMDLAGGANALSLSRASRVLAGAPETDRGQVFDAVTGRTTVPPALVDRLRTGAGTLQGAADGLLLRGRVLAQLPLQAGAGGGKGGRQVHVQSVDDEEVYGKATTGWFETQPVFDPELWLTAASGGLGRQSGFHAERRHRWRQTQVVLTGPDGVTLDGDINSRPTHVIPVGALALSFRSRTLPLPMRDEYTDVSALWASNTWFRRFNVTLVAFDPVVRFSAPAVAAEFSPDIIVESSVDEALRRARAENKRVLLIRSGGAYTAEDRHEPNGWEDPRVRGLLRAGFVCVQVYDQDKRWFEDQHGISSSIFHVVLAADGSVQDRFSYMGPPADWQAALAANAGGGTYLGHLRAELARTTSASEIAILRQKIARTALAALDYDEALTQYLWLADQQLGKPDWRHWTWRYALRQLANHPPSAARMRERHAAALAELGREPHNIVAAQTLLLMADALRVVAPLWLDFPRQIPRDHPERWSLLDGWISVSRIYSSPDGDSSLPAVVAALDLEQFFADGRAWAQQRVLAAKGRPEQEYAQVLASVRSSWAWAGYRCVEILEKAGQPEKARRLAREVLKVEGTSNLRQRLRNVLRNGDTDFPDEISVNER